MMLSPPHALVYLKCGGVTHPYVMMRTLFLFRVLGMAYWLKLYGEFYCLPMARFLSFSLLYLWLAALSYPL